MQVGFHTSRRSRIKGFTLIELLVVVATLSLLMAILLPALHRAKKTAKRLVCQSNLRQLSQAWMLYLEDNDGYFFQKRDANIEYGGWQGIRLRNGNRDPNRPLNPYLGLYPSDVNESEAKAFLCPADRGGVSGFRYEMQAYRWLGTSYQTNLMLIGNATIDTRIIPTEGYFNLHVAINKRLPKLKISRVASPARLLLVGDYGFGNQWRFGNIAPFLKELAEWHQRTDTHNMAFLDGHVKFVKIIKGLYVGDEYTVLPFKELYSMARTAQGEIF